MTMTSTLPAEAVVQRQLDAYNARDIDAFMALWSDDARYFESLLSRTLLARSQAEEELFNRR